MGPYRILGPLGRGGMGEVYRARDLRLERDIALKILHREDARDPQRLRRFAQEARAASALNHPGIVVVHDVGETAVAGLEAPVPYIAMELLEGKPLEELLREGALPLPRCLQLGAAIADALAAAHEAGIVHRDLKPSNVVVTPKGQPKILDFSLAKQDAGSSGGSMDQETLTSEGAILGTVGYMSPEQARGEGATAASDQFSFGCVLYEMITGRRAFGGSSAAETLSAILRDEPRPPDAWVPDTPAPLRWLLARCLSKSPEGRYASTRDLARDLQTLRDRHPELSSPVPGVEGTDRPAPRRRWLAPVAGLVAALALLQLPSRDGDPVSAPGGPIHTVAVLPIVNLTGDPEQEYFADGMTEALIADLARLRSFRVISRTSAMHYKGARQPLPEIARELGADALVEGSVARSGDRVRITVQLIDGRTDRHLWADGYERDFKDLLALQDNVARAITLELERTLDAPAAAERGGRAEPRLVSEAPLPRPVRPEAHEAFLRGRFHLNQRTEEALWKSVAFFERALEAEPDYARAHAGLAGAYALLGNYAFARPRNALPRARAAAERAVALDAGLGDGHAALGYARCHYDWDWAGAEDAFLRAVELSPSSALAHHWYAELLSAQGRHDEALAEVRRARDLDPLSVVVQANVARLLNLAGRHREAAAEARRALELEPGYVWARSFLALALSLQGRHDEALVAVEATGDDVARALVYGRAGRLDQARRLAARLEPYAREGGTPGFYMAEIHGTIGDRTTALAWLEHAYQEKEPVLVFVAVDPLLAGLEGDPRFRSLVSRLGLTGAAAPRALPALLDPPGPGG